MQYEKILNQIKNTDNTRIILIGAEAIVSLCYEALKYFHCNDVVFCDNSPEKQGNVFLGHQIVAPQAAISEEKETIVFLCFLDRNNEKAVRVQMQQMGITYIYTKYPLIYAYYKYIQKRTIDFEKFAHSIEVYEKNNQEENLVWENLELLVTDRCSLRCKDCALLMPYRTQHMEYDTRQMVETLKKISKSVDAIETLHILGGEPMLAPDLVEICKEASQIDNIHFIRIVTNGTLVPKDDVMDELKNYVGYIAVSDYGESSRKKYELKKASEKRSIPCEIRSIGNQWYAVDKTEFAARDEKESWKQFIRCDKYCHCPTIAMGKLFPCSVLVAQESFGQKYTEGVDYVDFSSAGEKRNNRQAILNILDRKKNFASTCGSCLYNFDCIVQGGVQL